MESGEPASPIGVGAKGTIVSLMEKELQMQGRAAKIQYLPIRNEAISAYCGSLLVKNTSSKNIPGPVNALAKAGSCRERRTLGGCNTSSLARSSSLRDSASRSGEDVEILHLHPPSSLSLHPRRKKIVSYAPCSGMLPLLDSDKDGDPTLKKSIRSTAATDESVPILSPGGQVLKLKSSSKQQSSPVFSSSMVEIVDTRCYRTHRELFRPLQKPSSQKKLKFFRLGEV